MSDTVAGLPGSLAYYPLAGCCWRKYRARTRHERNANQPVDVRYMRRNTRDERASARLERSCRCAAGRLAEINQLRSKLEQRSTLVAEIVAWFDVLDSAAYDGKAAEKDSQWPVDWLRRAREALPEPPQ